MITGAIIGVGAARRVSAVRWGIAGNIVIAWIVTLPATAAALTYFVFRHEPGRLTRSPEAYLSTRFRMLPSGSLNHATFMPWPTWMSPLIVRPGIS